MNTRFDFLLALSVASMPVACNDDGDDGSTTNSTSAASTDSGSGDGTSVPTSGSPTSGTATGDASTGGPSDGSTGDPNDGSTGAATTGNPDLCASNDPSESPVSETQLDSPYPDPAGGEIVDGTYELTRFEIYAPATADDHIRRRRIIFDQGTLVSVNQDDADPVQVRGGTFSVSGAQLMVELSCPDEASAAVPFTVSGDEVWTFDPSEPNIQVYQRL
jgi:hypothetical protein